MNTNILDCGHEPSTKPYPTVGYGVDPKTGKKYCYQCCADRERARMIETGRATLYFDNNEKVVNDWPGLLIFKLYPRIAKSFHNWAGNRYDYWFRGPDGYDWHGYTVGNNTQRAHCKRTKTK